MMQVKLQLRMPPTAQRLGVKKLPLWMTPAALALSLEIKKLPLLYAQ
jgi:hypothetical protein